MNRPVHFEIQADDVDRVKAFYENALGWKVQQVMTKDKGGMDYWMFNTGDSQPGINGGVYLRSEASEKLHTFDCTLGVEDIDTAVEAVRANGGTIVREKMEMPGIGWFASCLDTEGNKFGLMQSTAAGSGFEVK